MRDESDAILHVAKRLDSNVVAAVELLESCSGRVIVTGMGKMGCIARKAAATFSSTGTPALFLHAAEAAHGDLGIVTPQDVVVALSYSGSTSEVLSIVSHLRRENVSLISITGNPQSELAQHSQVVINVSVPDEADPISLAPTNSSTAALAVCDALAVALMHQRGFTREQFAIFHPGGNLGRKLLLKTTEVMKSSDNIPTASPDTIVKDVIVEISEKRMGAAIIIDSDAEVVGVFTDGDLRRVFERSENPLLDPVQDHMTANPVVTASDSLAAESLRIMEEKKITFLPVIDQNKKLVGAVHLHDLISTGLA